MFQVLLPVDSDEQRARQIAETAAKLPCADTDVSATILNVHPKLQDVDQSITDPDEWYDEDDFPDSVAEAVTTLEASGIEVEKRREFAQPAEAIVEIAEELKVDRIIMAGRKQTPVGKVLFGSVTQSVLLDSTRPVTVVGN